MSTTAPNFIISSASTAIHSATFRCVLSLLPITCAATFFATLVACHVAFTSVGLHPPEGIVCKNKASGEWETPAACLQMWQHKDTTAATDYTFHNVTSIYHQCEEQLCDISVYGGWFSGPEHTIFRVGITTLAAQLLVLLYGRLGLLQHCAPNELKTPCCCAGSVVTSDETCCSPSRCATLFGSCAVLFLIPMCYIPFYTSGWHFGSAVITFIALAVAEISDSIVQLRILRQKRPGRACGSCTALSRRGCVLNAWNFVMSAGGLVCFVLWPFSGSTYFEWMAASLPFFYFVPFMYQVSHWYLIPDSGSGSGGGGGGVGSGNDEHLLALVSTMLDHPTPQVSTTQVSTTPVSTMLNYHHPSPIVLSGENGLSSFISTIVKEKKNQVCWFIFDWDQTITNGQGLLKLRGGNQTLDVLNSLNPNRCFVVTGAGDNIQKFHRLSIQMKILKVHVLMGSKENEEEEEDREHRCYYRKGNICIGTLGIKEKAVADLIMQWKSIGDGIKPDCVYFFDDSIENAYSVDTVTKTLLDASLADQVDVHGIWCDLFEEEFGNKKTKNPSVEDDDFSYKKNDLKNQGWLDYYGISREEQIKRIEMYATYHQQMRTKNKKK